MGKFVLASATKLFADMLATVLIGISLMGFMTTAAIMLQSVAPDHFRGRITNMYLIHAGGIMAFSYFADGVLADIFNTGWILAVGSAAFLGVLFFSFFTPTPRMLYISGVPTQAPARS